MVFSSAWFSIIILFDKFWLAVGRFRLPIKDLKISFLYSLLVFWCFKFDMLKRLLVFLGFGWKLHLIMIFAMAGLWSDFVVVETDASESQMFTFVLFLT